MTDTRCRLNLEKPALVLTAVPKAPCDSKVYRKLEVLINSKTYMTTAFQLFDANGKDRVTYEFTDQKINIRPNDRDALLNPDLKGLEVVSETVE